MMGKDRWNHLATLVSELKYAKVYSTGATDKFAAGEAWTWNHNVIIHLATDHCVDMLFFPFYSKKIKIIKRNQSIIFFLCWTKYLFYSLNMLVFF